MQQQRYPGRDRQSVLYNFSRMDSGSHSRSAVDIRYQPSAPGDRTDVATPARTSGKRPDILDKSVVVITLCVWSGFFILPTVLGVLFPAGSTMPGVVPARAAVALAGAVLCLLMYLVLRRWGGPRPWPLLFKAIGLSVLPAICLALVGPYSLRFFTTFYEQRPGAWMHLETMAWNFAYLMWMMSTWSALFVGTAAALQVRQRDAQLAAAREAAQLAQLMALRMQVNPHFLFNSLSTLSGMVAGGAHRESLRLILNLSQFLRQTLTRAPFDGVPLSEELGMLRQYLDIESARFSDRLEINYEVPADCARALVPSLVLLPLAENSIKHALAVAEDGIVVRIGARREGDQLVLWLEDEAVAPGNAPARNPGLGIGLSNLQQQLSVLYGASGWLRAGPWEKGWRNIITIPWRETAS